MSLVTTDADFVAVARLDELRAGFATRHEVEGRLLLLTATANGVRAWDAICPHAEFLLEPGRLQRGCELECPMHGARFHADDGRVLKGPAKDPLEPIETRVAGGAVLVRIDWI